MIPPRPAADLEAVAAQSPEAPSPLKLVSHAEAVTQAPSGPVDEKRAPQETAQSVTDVAVTAVVEPWQPNLLQLWGVPIFAGLLLLGAYRFVLGVPLTQSS